MIGFLKRRNHDRLRALLSSYIDGQVDLAESAKVEQHLAECDECRSELESLRSTVSIVRALPELAIPRSFVLAEAPKPIRSASSPLVWTTRLATSAAAVLLFALVMGDALGLVTQNPTASREFAEFSVPASQRAVSAPTQSEEATQQQTSPMAPAMAAPAPAAAPMPQLPQQPGNPGVQGTQGGPGVPETAAPMAAAIQSAPAQPEPASAAAEPAQTPEAVMESFAASESAAPAPPQSFAAPAAPSALPTSAPAMRAQTDVNPSLGQDGANLEDESNLQDGGSSLNQPLESQMEPVSTILSEGAALDALPESPSVDDSTAGNFRSVATQSAGETSVGDRASTSLGGDLSAIADSPGIVLPLRQLEFAVGAAFLVLLMASLVLARLNGLWPFRR